MELNDYNLGRILNRFSSDIGAIDELLPTVLSDVLQVNYKPNLYYTIPIVAFFTNTYRESYKL